MRQYFSYQNALDNNTIDEWYEARDLQRSHRKNRKK